MKRSLRALLLTSAATAALVGPALPAHAQTCVGVEYEEPEGIKHAGAWHCATCFEPTWVLLGPGSDHWYVKLCFDIG